MHLCVCLFYSGGMFDLKNKTNNWMMADGIYESSLSMKYISSLYFSVVTCTTVGYGDIKPINDFELMWVVLVMLLGVCVFSFVLGDLAGQFGEITKSNKSSEDRNK